MECFETSWVQPVYPPCLRGKSARGMKERERKEMKACIG